MPRKYGLTGQRKRRFCVVDPLLVTAYSPRKDITYILRITVIRIMVSVGENSHAASNFTSREYYGRACYILRHTHVLG